MPAPSMATSTLAPPSCSSSPLHTITKTSNLISTTRSSLHFRANSSLSSKPFNPVVLIRPLLPVSPTRFLPPLAASSFDGETQENEPQYEAAAEHEQRQQQQQPVQASESGQEPRLYVGGLPYSMTSDELDQVFQEAGRVAYAKVIYDRATDRSRGFGFVTMDTLEEAKEAIKKFNGAKVGGRILTVNFPEVPKGAEREIMRPRIRTSYKAFVDTPYMIYAGNLSWRLTSDDLRDAFSEQPGLVSAKVIYERDTGRSRGFGFVSFSSAEDADAALNFMDGVEVEGRPLRLNLAAQKERPLATDTSNTENSIEDGELISSIGA
ncbi:hypothetical protein Tsubulata_022300 [Turnera subulata]|uniref:RRM domain-containing protein n=1 Tax=Turnera subulata TaxID=218843 RepID=A0A9Q0J6Z4_9ROSI|nr:hypothetical protein Tsubulata_022300 [Turnera subulata]